MSQRPHALDLAERRAFAASLRAHRQRAHLTPTVLAAVAGLAASTIEGWERGTTVPNVLMAARVARALGVPVDSLVAGVPLSP